MSYILDALKKSEEEREKHQRQKEARYPQLSDQPVPPRKNRIVPALIITSFLLLIALIMGVGVWFTIRDERPEQTVAPSVVEEQVQSDPARLSDKSDQIIPSLNQDIQHEKAMSVDEQSKPEPISPLGSDETAHEPVRQSTTEIPGPTGNRDQEKPLPFLTELPFSTRSMLPEMKFRGHAYSPTPDKRLVMINAVIVREGDTIAPDLRLTEITENGLIMSFRDIDFQIELFKNETR